MVSKKFLVTIFVIILSLGACSGRFLDRKADHDGLKNYHFTGGLFGFRGSGLREEDSSLVSTTVRVHDFGAKGNGKDDTQAFKSAWKEACSREGSVSLVIPNGNYVLKPITFGGPCKSDHITVHIHGTIEAIKDRSAYDTRWIVFDGIQHLTLAGGGTIDGNVHVWWDKTCTHKKSQPCIETAPAGLTFDECTNLVVRDLTVRNSQQMQVTFHKCNNVTASHLTVSAPSNSPNTDGIHITHSQNVKISDCVIGTGDDCISIINDSNFVRASNITCGPGHGISIGSLGAGNSEAHVSHVTVDGAKFTGTTNGLRIKTWQGGSGNVTNVKFMNVELNNVKNPIYIDQHYCIRRNSCPDQKSAVQVIGALYRNISGTSATNVAINFDCSKSFQCEGVVLEDIDIQYKPHPQLHHHGAHHHNNKVEASCKNVQFTTLGHVKPNCPHPSPPPPLPPSPPSPTSHSHVSRHARVFNVDHYGAKGDGNTDDSAAFENAWKDACSYEGSSSVVIPRGNNYLTKAMRFAGPCKSDDISFQIQGTIDASQDTSEYHSSQWILFDGVQHLTVQGGGTIDGHGEVWWEQTCKWKKTKPCTHSHDPTAIAFHSCENLVVKNLRVRDSPQMQVIFEKCKNVTVSDLHVIAPGNSPNTDGIHITHTQNFSISNTVIGTGDDCISIVSGSRFIRATNITCGPGHGISIGSLGSGNSEAHVSDVTVDGAKFFGTSNGLRIKTWQGGSGSVTNVKFMNVEMNNVENPILIDQNYCVEKSSCPEQSSAVQVTNVLYQNVTGSSASNVAIKLDCSKSFKCEGIVLQDINFHYQPHHGDHHNKKTVQASCKNADFTNVGDVSPQCQN